MNRVLAIFIVFICLTTLGCEEQIKGQYLEKGIVYFDQGKYKESELEIKNAIQEDPSVSEPYYYMALLNEKGRKYKAMKANLLKTVELAPENITAKLKLSKVYVLFNDVDNASNELENILLNDPKQLDALAIKASILIRQKKIDEALLIIDDILVNNPDHIEALSLKVVVLIRKKSFDEALLTLTPAIQKHSENISLHLLKIQLNSLLNNVEAVVADYEKLVQLKPDNVQLKLSLAKVYQKANKPQKAEETLTALVAQNPDLIRLKIALLDFIFETNEEKAVLQADEFLSKDQDKYKNIVILSKWLLGKNRANKAQDTIKSAIANEAISDEDKKALKLLLAKMEFEKKKFTEALSYIDNVLSLDGDNADAKVLKAQVQVVMGQYDKASILLKEILWQQPKMDKAMSLLGRVNEAQGDVDKAIVNYQNALKLNPRNLQALNFLVSKEVVEGHAAYAIELLERALRLLPSNVMILLKLVELNINEQKWDVATQYIKKIKLQKNGILIAEFMQGKVLQQQEKYAEALVSYKKLLDKAPWIKDALSGVVECYTYLNQQEKAKIYVDELINNHSNIVFPYIVKSQLLSIDNLPKQAISLLSSVLEQDKLKYSAIYIELARLYKIIGDKENEQNIYVEALKIWPNDIELMLHLASFFEGIQEVDKAVRLYESILQVNPMHGVSKNNLATLLLDFYGEEKDINKAVQMVSSFKQAKQPYFLDTYGWAKLKSGKIEKALSIFKQVTILAPNVPVFRYHLAVAYNTLGDQISASSELKQALYLGKGKNFPESGLIKKLLAELKNK